MITEQIVSVDSSVPLDNFNLSGVDIHRGCLDKVPIMINWGGANRRVYMDPKTNIVYKTAHEIQCSATRKRIISVNGSNY